MHCTPFSALSLGRHHDVRDLQRWHLACQRKHLVHSDPGSDRGIAQAGLANRLTILR